MSLPDYNEEEMREKLKWITLKDENMSVTSKLKSKGLSGILVPLGCTATVGVLATGLYYLYKKDQRKQQLFMRYRVLAQGLTIAVMFWGALKIGSS